VNNHVARVQGDEAESEATQHIKLHSALRNEGTRTQPFQLPAINLTGESFIFSFRYSWD
jgi:hypothetical protein